MYSRGIIRVGDNMNGLIVENVNDILSLLTLGCIIGIPVFYGIRKLYSVYLDYTDRRIERLMKEEDWHM